MRSVSDKYQNYINSSLVRRPRSKFVIDNIHYSGEKFLVSYPKVEHKTEKAIGSFPAKTCELEILNRDGTFNLHGKEVTVYRGLEIDGATEWVRIGVFMASDENIKTNINKKTITFKGTDKTQLFDKPYGGKEQWNTSKRVLHIVKEICSRNGVELASAEFPMNEYTFPDIPPGIDFDNITDRQMIACIAELGGCIAMFTYNGKLAFKSASNTGFTITKGKYKNFSVENAFGPINAVSFGYKDYENALLHMMEGVTDATKVEWAINDNPLTTTTDKNNLIQLVSENYFGRSFVPFEIEDIIDDYIFDLNDIVTVEKKDGTTVDVTLLEMSVSSRIKSKFSAALQTPGKTKTALAGSTKERLGKVELLVNHQSKTIETLVADGKKMSTAIKESAEVISAQAKKIETIEENFEELDIEGAVKTEITKEATIKILADAVETKISGDYVSTSDLENYVKTETFTAQNTVTENKITDLIKRTSTIETAGYITENSAQSLIDASIGEITLAVTENMKRANKNLFVDSECFESATADPFRSELLLDRIITDDALPLRRVRQIGFWGDSNATYPASIGFTLRAKDTIGQEAGSIDKLKAGATYALSFKAKCTQSEVSLSVPNFLYVGKDIKAQVVSNSNFSFISKNEWQDFTIVFKLSDNPMDFSLRFFVNTSSQAASYGISFSSFMLVESETPVEWVPDAASIDQSVEAKLSLYVKTDENGNLQSAIHAKANQITIESDNFTLDAEGKMTCTGATINGGSIDIAEANERVKIAEGRISVEYRDSEDSSFEEIGWIQAAVGSFGITADKVNFIGKSDSTQAEVTVNGKLTADEIYSSEIKTPMCEVFYINESGTQTKRITISSKGYRYDYDTAGTHPLRDIIESVGGMVLKATGALHLESDNQIVTHSILQLRASVELGRDIAINSASTTDTKALTFNTITKFNGTSAFYSTVDIRSDLYMQQGKDSSRFFGVVTIDKKEVKYSLPVVDIETGKVHFLVN